MREAPPGYAIRSSHRSDLSDLPAIELSAATLFSSVGLDGVAASAPRSEETFDRLHGEGTLWIAADDADRPVGFLGGHDLDGAFFIMELAVGAGHGGRGLGSALLDAAVEHARWLCYGAVALTTYRDVPWNAPFYRRRGFLELSVDGLSPGLKAILAAEATGGHDPARRCAMARRL